MAMQYTDGSWGETKPLDEALEDFKEASEFNLARKLVTGSHEEIEAEKLKDQLAAQVAELEKRMDQVDSHKQFDRVVIPTNDEIREFNK